MHRILRQTQSLLLLAVCIAIATPAVLRGEENLRPSLPAELGWAKFRVTAGRLHVVNAQFRESKTYEAGNPLTGESETFRINVSADSADVQYQLTSPRQRLTVHFDAPSSVIIQRIPGEEGDIVPLEYLQPREGSVELILGEGRNLRRHRAASFWHLMMLAPKDVEQHLLPILTGLRPGWQIVKTQQGIENALVQLAQTNVLPDRAAWAELVEQLGSDKFSQRRQAERQLRAIGPSVLAYLKTIPLEELDAERRVRMEHLLESLSSTVDDTPARIAMWLIDDPLIWTTVLASNNAEYRAVAKGQLEKLLKRSIAFDVDGDEQLRSTQLDAIRAMVPRS